MAISYKLDLNKSVLRRGVSSIRYDSAVRLGIIRGLANPTAMTNVATGSKWTGDGIGKNDIADAINLIVNEQGSMHPVYTNLPLAFVSVRRFAPTKAFIELEYRRFNINVLPGQLRADYDSTYISVPWYRNNRTVDSDGLPNGELIGHDWNGADVADDTKRPRYYMLSIPGVKLSVPAWWTQDPFPAVFFMQGKINKNILNFFTYQFSPRQIRYDGMHLKQIVNEINNVTVYQYQYQFTALKTGFYSMDCAFSTALTGAFPSYPSGNAATKQWRTLKYLSHEEVDFTAFPPST